MHNELEVLEETVSFKRLYIYIKTHPNIMRIFELLEDNKHYYIVSELIEGGELYKRICQLRTFNERAAAGIMR